MINVFLDDKDVNL